MLYSALVLQTGVKKLRTTSEARCGEAARTGGCVEPKKKSPEARGKGAVGHLRFRVYQGIFSMWFSLRSLRVVLRLIG